MIILYIILIILFLYTVSYLLNWLSYRYLKNKYVKKGKWDLNICCGKTDYGKVNADIIKHAEVKGFVLINDIYNLPFRDKEFENVLCSHTIEHVDDPQGFDKELNRVGKNVLYLVPPLWDVSAAFNFIEHKWLFLTFRTNHSQLPLFTGLPFSRIFHKFFGQRKKA